MHAIEAETSAPAWAANLARIGDLQDERDILQIALSDATQRLALYRAEAVNTAALLRQERAMTWVLMMALFWTAGADHAA